MGGRKSIGSESCDGAVKQFEAQLIGHDACDIDGPREINRQVFVGEGIYEDRHITLLLPFPRWGKLRLADI